MVLFNLKSLFMYFFIVVLLSFSSNAYTGGGGGKANFIIISNNTLINGTWFFDGTPGVDTSSGFPNYLTNHVAYQPLSIKSSNLTLQQNITFKGTFSYAYWEVEMLLWNVTSGMNYISNNNVVTSGYAEPIINFTGTRNSWLLGNPNDILTKHYVWCNSNGLLFNVTCPVGTTYNATNGTCKGSTSTYSFGSGVSNNWNCSFAVSQSGANVTSVLESDVLSASTNPPLVTLASIIPSSTYANAALNVLFKVTGSGVNGLNVSIVWFNGSNKVDGYGASNYPFSYLSEGASYSNSSGGIPVSVIRKGQNWRVQINVSNGTYYNLLNASQYNPLNSLPSITASLLRLNSTSTNNYSSGNITIYNLSSAYDADNWTDSTSFKIKWYNNTIIKTSLENQITIMNGNLSKGDVWTAEIWPYDGIAYGSPLNESITIMNSPPSITSLLFRNTTLFYVNDTSTPQYTFSDYNGDGNCSYFTYFVNGFWNKSGRVNQSGTLTTPTLTGFLIKQNVTVQMTPNDCNDTINGTSVNWTETVSIFPPTITQQNVYNYTDAMQAGQNKTVNLKIIHEVNQWANYSHFNITTYDFKATFNASNIEVLGNSSIAYLNITILANETLSSSVNVFNFTMVDDKENKTHTFPFYITISSGIPSIAVIPTSWVQQFERGTSINKIVTINNSGGGGTGCTATATGALTSYLSVSSFDVAENATQSVTVNFLTVPYEAYTDSVPSYDEYVDFNCNGAHTSTDLHVMFNTTDPGGAGGGGGGGEPPTTPGGDTTTPPLPPTPPSNPVVDCLLLGTCASPASGSAPTILSYDNRTLSINQGACGPVSITYAGGIYKIEICVKEQVANANVQVWTMNGTKEDLPIPTGAQYLSYHVLQSNIPREAYDSIKVHFKVKNEWIDANPGTIMLQYWNGRAWSYLNTVQETSSAQEVSYLATAYEFGSYAIVSTAERGFCGDKTCQLVEDKISCPSDCSGINLDTLLCIGDKPCLWKQGWFLRVSFIMLLLAVAILVLGKNKNSLKKRFAKSRGSRG